MKSLQHLASQLFNTPLAIDPAKLEAILAAVGPRFGLDTAEFEAAAGGPAMDRKAYSVVDGIACIPVQGTLMKKAYGLWAYSGCSSYENLRVMVEDAITDPEVKGILLDCDSPGGSTHGCFELCDFLYSMRGEKPMYAVANDSALSAAYAIASCADRIFVTRTGAVGSIGVFCMHLDQAGADEKQGLKYTYIYAGKKKVDGNPHEPLSKSAKADSQSEVDRQYEMFVATVSRNRNASADDVRATEAGAEYADGSVPLLADEVGTFEDAFSALSAKVNGRADISSASFAAIADEGKGDNQMAKIQTPAVDETLAAIEEIETPKAAVAKEESMDDAKAGVDDEDDDDEELEKNASTVQISNLCILAGRPELAATYIVKGFSVAKVQDRLLALRAKKSAEVPAVSSHTTSAVSLNAMDTIDSQAAALAANTNTPLPKAYLALLQQNPQLYTQYLDERQDAMATQAGQRAYVAALNQRLRA